MYKKLIKYNTDSNSIKGDIKSCIKAFKIIKNTNYWYIESIPFGKNKGTPKFN